VGTARIRGLYVCSSVGFDLGRFEIRVIARRSRYIGLIADALADALGDGDGAVGERVAEFAQAMVMPG
jgi:hypothetical protein